MSLFLPVCTIVVNVITNRIKINEVWHKLYLSNQSSFCYLCMHAYTVRIFGNEESHSVQADYPELMALQWYLRLRSDLQNQMELHSFRHEFHYSGFQNQL